MIISSVICEVPIVAFAILVLKDWLLSAVDFYPYANSVIASVGVVIGAWLALCKFKVPSAGTVIIVRATERIVAVLIALVTAVLLLVFLHGLPQIRWTDDAILGLGLGARTLSTTYLSTVEQITPVLHPNTAVGAIVTEQGLLTLFAVGALIVVSAIATVQLAWMPDRRREATLAVVGMAGVDILLGMSLRGPAFLTLDTTWGTCALIVSLACVGMALQSATAPEVAPEPREVRWGRYRRRLRRTVIAIAVVIPVLLITNAVVERYVASTIARDRRTIQVPIAGVSQPMIDATIAMEDGHFYEHGGIDFAALHRALRFDLRLGRIEQGGSTITMELAKNLYLQDNDRTLWRKTEDIVLAAEMERVLSKRQILELYLNTIDYGMGQHGIKAAADYYFHQTPSQLTVPEAACLVGIVPDPFQQQIDLGRAQEGEQTALGRMAYFFPKRYSSADIDAAGAIPLDRLIYPFKDAWDRGATHEIPATWHGVSFYFYADPHTPLPVDNCAKCFKDRLAGFLDDAHKHLGLVGIDHLGLYNDRTTRFSTVDLSAHAFGQAMDMSGFRFADGARIKVVDHKNPAVMKRLAPVEAMLNRHFDAVVDWNDNALHQTHFHVEVKGRRDFPYRSPTAAPL